MGGKSSFFILLVVVAILTLTLAVLAGYLFFVSGTPNTESVVVSSETVEPTRPGESELGHYKLFEEKQYFNLKDSDDKKLAVIQLAVQIDYFKGKNAEKSSEKLLAFDAEIKELIGTYFQNLTLEEVKMPEAKEKAKNDLKKKINDLITSADKQRTEFVYNVIFYEWFCQ